MEIQKTKGELLAFLESSGANSLIDFLGSSSSVNLAVADELDEMDSSSSSSEVEETIEDAKEAGRDDEDFIILMEPKKQEKVGEAIHWNRQVQRTKIQEEMRVLRYDGDSNVEKRSNWKGHSLQCLRCQVVPQVSKESRKESLQSRKNSR
jgi:hypothetical protein